VGIEACPTAHHWGRELQAVGHTVKLMPPSYVKAYLKRSKNDANDATAMGIEQDEAEAIAAELDDVGRVRVGGGHSVRRQGGS